MKTNIWQIIIPIIILVLLAGGYFYWKQKNEKNIIADNSKTITNNKTISNDDIKNQISAMKENVPNDSKITTKDFSNPDHNITLKYPDNWQEKDLGGAKNITEPLTRENIAYFYVSISQLGDDPTSSLVNVKLLRFSLGDDANNIQTSDDWYNYIKKKVDDFIANKTLSANYQFTSLESGQKIDGKWIVEENYTENNLLRGKDYYIFNDRDMYQFVTKAPIEYFDAYFPQIETIVNSFSIK